MQQAKDPNFTLANFSPEEGKAVIAKLDKFMAENSAELVVTPLINPNGTIGAKVEIFKKVELVPKEGSVVSPIQVNDLKAGPEEAGAKA